MADQVKVNEYEVVHPRLYLSPGGKRQHVPAGTKVKLTAEQAKNLLERKRVKPVSEAEILDVTAGTETDDDSQSGGVPAGNETGKVPPKTKGQANKNVKDDLTS